METMKKILASICIIIISYMLFLSPDILVAFGYKDYWVGLVGLFTTMGLPLLVCFILGLIAGTDIKKMWFFPIFTPLPLFLFMFDISGYYKNIHVILFALNIIAAIIGMLISWANKKFPSAPPKEDEQNEDNSKTL